MPELLEPPVARTNPGYHVWTARAYTLSGHTISCLHKVLFDSPFPRTPSRKSCLAHLNGLRSNIPLACPTDLQSNCHISSHRPPHILLAISHRRELSPASSLQTRRLSCVLPLLPTEPITPSCSICQQPREVPTTLGYKSHQGS